MNRTKRKSNAYSVFCYIGEKFRLKYSLRSSIEQWVNVTTLRKRMNGKEFHRQQKEKKKKNEAFLLLSPQEYFKNTTKNFIGIT